MNETPMIKRLFFLGIGFSGILGGINVFPTTEPFTFSNWLGEVLFSPFSLLGAILLFIIGFLSMSFLIRGLFEKRNIQRFTIKDYIILLGLFMSYVILIKFSIVGAGLAFVLSLSYGIMDADLKREEKYFKKLG